MLENLLFQLTDLDDFLASLDTAQRLCVRDALLYLRDILGSSKATRSSHHRLLERRCGLTQPRGMIMCLAFIPTRSDGRLTACPVPANPTLGEAAACRSGGCSGCYDMRTQHDAAVCTSTIWSLLTRGIHHLIYEQPPAFTAFRLDEQSQFTMNACPACSQPTGQNDLFCPKCGISLNPGTSTAGPASASGKGSSVVVIVVALILGIVASLGVLFGVMRYRVQKRMLEAVMQREMMERDRAEQERDEAERLKQELLLREEASRRAHEKGSAEQP